MNNRSSSLFILIRIISVIEKFLFALGLEKGSDSESTFEVVRHFINCEGDKKIVLFDPRISLDDQDIKFMKVDVI